MPMLVLTLLTFKKVKLIFGHPVLLHIESTFVTQLRRELPRVFFFFFCVS